MPHPSQETHYDAMKKFNVNIDRAKPSSEEILSRRNFDELMKQYNAAAPKGGKVVKPVWKSMWFAGALAMAAAVVVTFIVLKNTDSTTEKTNAPIVNGPDTRHPDSTGTSRSYVQQEKRRVAPPLKGLDIAFTSYKLNSRRGGTITHPSGSKLVFPANAFVDGNGSPVNGDVDVQYREFRDPVDVFVAGIPLQYDSAGKTFQFESAGMMQLTAFINGKVVYLDKTKPVEVQFATKQSGTGFNVYEFDTTAGNWIYQGKDRIQPKDQLAANGSQQQLTASQIEQKKGEAQATFEHALADAQKNNPVPQEPLEPRKADKKKNKFSVEFDVHEFPELAVYKNSLWEVDESREKFDRNLVYNTTWNDMKLMKSDQEGEYVYVLKKGLTEVHLDVYPVLDGDNYAKAKASYDQKFSTYQSALTRRTDAEKTARTQYENTLKNIGLSDAMVQVDEKYKQSNEDAAATVMRVFTVNHFGIYNCDAPGNYPQGAHCIVTLMDENGGELDHLTSLYHVDRNKFGLYSYFGGVLNFNFNPGSSNLIWGVKEGTLMMADDDQFGNLKTNSNGMLIMHEVNREFKSADDMKVFFRIPAGV